MQKARTKAKWYGVAWILDTNHYSLVSHYRLNCEVLNNCRIDGARENVQERYISGRLAACQVSEGETRIEY